MIAIVVIALTVVVLLGFLCAWRLDRTAKRHGATSLRPAKMIRMADVQRRNPEAVEHWVTFQSHTGL